MRYQSVLTTECFQGVEHDLRRCLVWLSLSRGIEDTVHQVDLGVVEHKMSHLGKKSCRTTITGTGGSEVDERKEESLQGVVEGLEQGKSQSYALHWHTYNTQSHSY